MIVSQYHNKNQFLIELQSKVYLQSYASVVAKYDFTKAELTLYEDWDYSNTTRKHVYMFMYEYAKIDTFRLKNKRKSIIKFIKLGIIKETKYKGR